MITSPKGCVGGGTIGTFELGIILGFFTRIRLE